MATVEKAKLFGEKRIVLSGISWELYERLRDNEENRHVRMVYDDGRLELMSPSPDHEAIKELICDMIKAFTEELGIAQRSLGSTTWKRPDLAKGLEPDGCFYILNHHRVCRRRHHSAETPPKPSAPCT